MERHSATIWAVGAELGWGRAAALFRCEKHTVAKMARVIDDTT